MYVFPLLIFYSSIYCRNEHSDYVKKPTIHRLVTPEGFQLSTNSESTPRFWQSHFGSSKEFNQPFNNERVNNHHDKIGDSLDVTPLSRTRFSRATRSPLKYDVEFDSLPIINCPSNSLREDNIDNSFTEKGTSMKNSFGNKNRCKTCNKVSLFFYVLTFLQKI